MTQGEGVDADCMTSKYFLSHVDSEFFASNVGCLPKARGCSVQDHHLGRRFDLMCGYPSWPLQYWEWNRQQKDTIDKTWQPGVLGFGKEVDAWIVMLSFIYIWFIYIWNLFASVQFYLIRTFNPLKFCERLQHFVAGEFLKVLLVGVLEPFQLVRKHFWCLNQFRVSIRLGLQAAQRHYGHHVFTVLFSPLDLITTTVTEVDGSVVVLLKSFYKKGSLGLEFAHVYQESGASMCLKRKPCLSNLQFFFRQKHIRWRYGSSSVLLGWLKAYLEWSRVALSQQASFPHALRKGFNKDEKSLGISSAVKQVSLQMNLINRSRQRFCRFHVIHVCLWPLVGSPHRPSCCALFWWSAQHRWSTQSFSCEQTWFYLDFFSLSDIEMIWNKCKTNQNLRKIKDQRMIKGWSKDDQRIPEGLEANELQGLNDISQEYIIAFVRGPRWNVVWRVHGIGIGITRMLWLLW